MTDQNAPPLTLSGPSVSRWWGPFPELRRNTLGFFLRCQTYGDVVKLPMGLVIELLLRKRDAATYVLNHPADIKHVLVTNQDNYQKGWFLLLNPESSVWGFYTPKVTSITINDGSFCRSFTETMSPRTPT